MVKQITIAQIEPVEFLWVNGEIKLGVNLEVYGTYFGLDALKAEITDIDDRLLFTTIIAAKTLEEVAQQLNLKLKTDNTKQLLTEIMEADAKDGLYEQEQRMYSEKEVLQLLLRLQQTESYNNLYDWFEQNKKQ